MNLTNLATEVGRSKGVVSRWTKRPDWPISRKGPWKRSDVEKVRSWMGLLKDTGDATPADEELYELKVKKVRQEIRKLNAQAEATETALAKQRASLIDAGDAEASWKRITGKVRAAVAGIPSQVAGLAVARGMPAEAAAAFEEQTAAAVNGILRHLRGSQSVEPGDAEEVANG